MIYFIRHGDSQYIKIGYTSHHPEMRMTELQCGNPIKLTLLGHGEGSLSDEALLHRILSAHRVSGEWFEETDELTAIMGKIIAGTFPWWRYAVAKTYHRTVKFSERHTVEDITYRHPAWLCLLRLTLTKYEYANIVDNPLPDVQGRPNWNNAIKAINGTAVDWSREYASHWNAMGHFRPYPVANKQSPAV